MSWGTLAAVTTSNNKCCHNPNPKDLWRIRELLCLASFKIFPCLLSDFCLLRPSYFLKSSVVSCGLICFGCLDPTKKLLSGNSSLGEKMLTASERMVFCVILANQRALWGSRWQIRAGIVRTRLTGCSPMSRSHSHHMVSVRQCLALSLVTASQSWPLIGWQTQVPCHVCYLVSVSSTPRHK